MIDINDLAERLGTIVSQAGLRTTRWQYQPNDVNLIPGDDNAGLERLGVHLRGNPDCTFAVTDLSKSLGNIRITNAGSNNVFFFDNKLHTGNIFMFAQVSGSDCTVMFCGLNGYSHNYPTLSLRSNRQIFFSGAECSAVGVNVEIDGEGCSVLFGDDCMLSSGIWLRNHDMHTIFDLSSGDIINPPPVSCVLEQHIWVGQDAFLLGTEHIGFGSVVAAQSLTKGRYPSTSLIGGTPARVLRRETSWCRHPRGVTPGTRERLAHLQALS